jgi:[acyl-carrier-protein] S-malonyltransferase
MEKMKHNKKRLAYIFPGQGSQYIGMGKDFYDNFGAAKETFQQADSILSKNISDLIFNGNEDELTKTINCQVAIYINSIAIMRVMNSQFTSLTPNITAGLSLGEYSALCAADKFSFEEGLLLLNNRAKYIHRECVNTEGAMAAVLGIACEDVEMLICDMQKDGCDIWAANFNCPNQTVISGSKSCIDKASIELKKIGAKRVVTLNVAGAFHSGIMKNAENSLREDVFNGTTTFKEGTCPVVMNVSGEIVDTVHDIKDMLVKQVTSSVRWEKSIRTIEDSGCDYYLEVGCGQVLAGLNKKIRVKANTISVGTITDLDVLAKELDL